MGWKLWKPEWRRFQVPYNKSISRVSAGQMQSVLHHIHQRLGLRAWRLLARSKDLHKWVQQQLKAAITSGKTISNICYEQLQTLSVTCEHHTAAQMPLLQKSPRATQTWQRRQISLSLSLTRPPKPDLPDFWRNRINQEIMCSCDLFLSPNQISGSSPTHWYLCTCIQLRNLINGLWTYEEEFLLIIITASCQICVCFHPEPQSGLWAANNDTWSLVRLFLSIPLLLHLGEFSWGNLYNHCTFAECHTFHVSSSAFFYIPSLLGVE